MLLMPQRAQGVRGCMGQCEQKSPEGRAWPQWPGTHEGHTFWAEVARGFAGARAPRGLLALGQGCKPSWKGPVVRSVPEAPWPCLITGLPERRQPQTRDRGAWLLQPRPLHLRS